MNSSKYLHERRVREGQGPEPVDATVKDDNGPLPPTSYKRLLMVCKEAKDPTSSPSVDNCASHSFPVTFEVNCAAGSEVQPSPTQLNLMDMF